MPTPKINVPTFDVILPSENKKIKMKMMRGKDEKILLVAKENKDDGDIFEAIKQVINNCLVEKLEVDKLPIFDIEYLFLKLRAVSINNMLDLELTDPDDGKVYPVRIDLQEVEVKNLKNDTSNIITISNNIKLQLKYPSGKVFSEKVTKDKTILEQLDMLIVDCLDKLYQGDDTFDFKNSTTEEKLEFLEELDTKTLEKIVEYVGNLPSVEHTISYTNSLGEKKEYTLRTLSDFFMLR